MSGNLVESFSKLLRKMTLEELGSPQKKQLQENMKKHRNTITGSQVSINRSDTFGEAYNEKIIQEELE